MPNGLRVVLEVGPKQRRVVAVALDWPGLERGGRTAEAALEALESYRRRYAKVAALAGLAGEFASAQGLDVTERYAGVGSTDFWGISFAFCSLDRQRMSGDEMERLLILMRGCWTFFDDVRNRVSADLRKGPRGGGRSRDEIVGHVLRVEQDWGKKVGVPASGADAPLPDDGVLAAYHEAYCAAIRTFNNDDRIARTWPLRYLIRHTAYHTMDHAWEMEDKDLS